MDIKYADHGGRRLDADADLNGEDRRGGADADHGGRRLDADADADADLNGEDRRGGADADAAAVHGGRRGGAAAVHGARRRGSGVFGVCSRWSWKGEGDLTVKIGKWRVSRRRAGGFHLAGDADARREWAEGRNESRTKDLSLFYSF